MKGRLIKLSAYGEKLKCLARYRNKVGMVLESSVSAGDLGYMVLWSGETKIMRMRIRDVKFVK